MNLTIPEKYDPKMSVRETEAAIKYIRDTFQREFGKEMGLERISAPLFVPKSSGLNDNLNGVERPVAFDAQDIPGEGLYTNMNAISRDEELDNLHSVYVDQWDWERVITREQRKNYRIPPICGARNL